MCGFIGMFKYSLPLTENDRKDIVNMSSLISHRGPDSDKCLFLKNAGFGFRRLSIIDLEGGEQPYVSPDGRYVAVYNGEIYNYLVLRDELIKSGEKFATRSEIEVMVRLYSIYGASFINRLRGMFSFLIYDNLKNTIMAGRDPFGIKPLYYRESKDGVIFSSEMKAYLADSSYDGFKVDKTLLQHYMTFQYVTEPDTISGDIKILPAGHYMTVGKTTDTTCYYKSVFSPNKSLKYDEKKKALREAVEKSVEAHLLSDVPVGAFLSSGVDSAIVTAIASKIQPGIKAFTIGFDVKGYSELEDAEQISKHLHINHIKLQCNIKDFTDNYERVIYHLDSPVADPSVVAIYLISKEAAKHVKVVLTGEGSDELFGGYRIYDTVRSSAFLARFPSFLKRMLLWVASSLPDNVKGKNFLIRSCTPLEKRYVGNSFVFSENAKKDILKTFDKSVCFTDRTKDIFAESRGSSPLIRMQHCDMNTWLRSDILVKGDRLSMANSLEARVPFLDKEVFKAASLLCDKDKIKKHTTKYILRDVFSDILNKETIVRPKLGYPVPVRVWLKDELYDWASDIIRNSTAGDYINSAEALKLLEDHRRGKADLYHEIWVILTFITWYKLYIDGGYKNLID
ncbi:MAG: asparagine synthase (glutamine-hydrolyzing) [Clostridiales bacterium]|jgi:asparagine synthase (glutamine-hydrolysing)|nr:asparagine synthase (glutamine-hydrolyzing) [Clostridiales bacterium]